MSFKLLHSLFWSLNIMRLHILIFFEADWEKAWGRDFQKHRDIKIFRIHFKATEFQKLLKNHILYEGPNLRKWKHCYCLMAQSVSYQSK